MLNLDELSKYEPRFHEEFMIKAFFIALIKDDELKFDLASDFIKTLPNWAVCDSFEPKFKDGKFVNLLLAQAQNSPLEYEKRFFYIYYMRNFDALSFERFFEICLAESDERYYVQMAMAWVLAEIFIKFDEPARELLKSKKLSKFVQNKTISKIRDSFRVPKVIKDEVTRLKI